MKGVFAKFLPKKTLLNDSIQNNVLYVTPIRVIYALFENEMLEEMLFVENILCMIIIFSGSRARQTVEQLYGGAKLSFSSIYVTIFMLPGEHVKVPYHSEGTQRMVTLSSCKRSIYYVRI